MRHFEFDKPEVSRGSHVWLSHGVDGRLGVGKMIWRTFSEVNVFLSFWDDPVHVVDNEERHLHVAVDDPVHTEIVVVVSERVDQLLSHLKRTLSCYNTHAMSWSVSVVQQTLSHPM